MIGCVPHRAATRWRPHPPGLTLGTGGHPWLTNNLGQETYSAGSRTLRIGTWYRKWR